MLALSLTSEMPTRHCSPRLRMLPRFGCDRIGRAPEAGPTINAVADRELEGEGARFAAAELATPVPHHQVSELFRARQQMRAALSLGAPGAPSRQSGPPSFAVGGPELEGPTASSFPSRGR